MNPFFSLRNVSLIPQVIALAGEQEKSFATTMINRIRFTNKGVYSLGRYQSRRLIRTNINLHPEVEEAIFSGKPVVALESTIISHGMPYPRNMEVALELENIIRKAGAIPATTAIINGFCKVGLQNSEIEILVSAYSSLREMIINTTLYTNVQAQPKSKDSKIMKASRRDIAHACSHGLNAGMAKTPFLSSTSSNYATHVNTLKRVKLPPCPAP